MITHMNAIDLRALSLADTNAVVALYEAVAAGPDSGLARRVDEISREYVAGFLARALIGGVALGAFAGDADRLAPDRRPVRERREARAARHADRAGRSFRQQRRAAAL